MASSPTAGPPTVDSPPLEEARFDLLITQGIFMCIYTVLVFDWLMCLKREFKLVWTMRWSMAKLLYLFSRYWPLITVPFVLNIYVEPRSAESCERLFRVPVGVAVWNQVCAEMILLVRTVAFLGRRRDLALFLALCLTAALSYQVWVIFVPMIPLPFIPPATKGPCLPMSIGNQIVGFFLSSMMFDTLVTSLMMVQVYRFRIGPDEYFRPSRMYQIFVAEGLFYFVLASTANIVNGILYSLPNHSLNALFVPFSNMIPNIMACRLILDLREEGRRGDNVTWVTSGHTDRAFAIPDLLVALFTRKHKHIPRAEEKVSTMHFGPPFQSEVPTGASMPVFAEPEEKTMDLERGSNANQVRSTLEEWRRDIPIQSFDSSQTNDLPRDLCLGHRQGSDRSITAGLPSSPITRGGIGRDSSVDDGVRSIDL